MMYELAADLLAECEDLLDPNVTGRDLPARRYVSHGEPPVEFCHGLLAVWTGPVEVRQVNQSTGGATFRVVSYSVDVWRCWPTGDTEPATPEVLSGAALVLADDVDRLTLGLSLFLSHRCGNVEWRPAVALGPSGGMAGWRLTVAVAV